MTFSEFYKSGSPTATTPPSNLTNTLFSIVWGLSGLATVVGPIVYRHMRMGNYRNMWEAYNWEEVEQNYQENQEQYYQQMQQYAQGGYQSNWEQQMQQGTYDINQCKWFQFNCFPYYINENGQPEPTAGWYPSWFSGWTVSEEEREQMLEAGQTSSALIFTYVWQIIMFIVILAYGFIVIRQNRVVSGITVALVVFANMCFLALWMLADGTIITDGEYIQEVGFYGQFPVLMFMTNAWYVIFGIVFAALFHIRGHFMYCEKPVEEKEPEATGENYKALDTPPTDAPPLVV